MDFRCLASGHSSDRRKTYLLRQQELLHLGRREIGRKHHNDQIARLVNHLQSNLDLDDILSRHWLK